MGGAVSTPEEWEALSAEWVDVLRAYDLPTFHMVDFENNANEFRRERGWCDERKWQLLNALLGVIDRHVRAFVGAGAFMKNPKKIPPTYAHIVTQTIGKVITQVRSWGDDNTVRLVFAKHPELSYKRIEVWCNRLKRALPGLHGCTGEEPRRVPPLQVADIVAYEYTRTEGRPESRYPIRSLYTSHRIHNFFFTSFAGEA